MNEDFDDIQRLIRLKRHESPGEGYTEDFLARFQQRQREELLRKSSLELLIERISTRFEALLSPRWALAGAAAAVCVVGIWVYSNPSSAGAGSVAGKTEQTSPSGKSESEEAQGKPSETKRDPKALPAKGWQDGTPATAAPAIHDGSPGSIGL